MICAQNTQIRFDVRVGQSALFAGDLYRVDEVQEEQIILRNQKTKAIKATTHKELFSEIQDGKLVLRLNEEDLDGTPIIFRGNLEKDLSCFSESNLKEARDRLAFVEAVLEYGPKTPRNEPVESIVERITDEIGYPRKQNKKKEMKGPTARTISDWIKRYKSGGHKIQSLVPGHNGKGNCTDRLHKVLRKLMRQCLSEYYLRREQPTYQSAFDSLQPLLDEWNRDHPSNPISMPNIKTFCREFKKLDPYEVAVERYGQKKADEMFVPVFRMKESLRPMEMVQVDHTPLDCMIKIPGIDIPARPTLTILTDQYSRMVVGFYISFYTNGYIPIMMATRSMIWSKDGYYKKYPHLKNDWPCMGPCENFLYDNDSGMTSEDAMRAFEGTDIKAIYCEVGTPQQKAHVESLLGKINNKASELPGKTGRNPIDRGDYDSTANASLSIEDLEEWIVSILVDDHHVSWHSGIRSTPLDKWNEGIKSFPLRAPSKSWDGVEVATAVYSDHEPKVQTKGVYWKYDYYNSNELAILRKNAGGDINVTIKYDPMDVGFVWVLDKTESNWLKVQAVDTNRNAMTLIALEFHLEKTAKPANNSDEAAEVRRSRAAIKNRVDQKRPKSSKQAKRLARMEGVRIKQPAEYEADAKLLQPSPEGFDDMITEEDVSSALDEVDPGDDIVESDDSWEGDDDIDLDEWEDQY